MVKVVFMINWAAADPGVREQPGVDSFIRNENGQRLRWYLRVLHKSFCLVLIEKLQNGWTCKHLKSVLEEAVKQPAFQEWCKDGDNTYLWIHKGDFSEAAAPGNHAPFEDLKAGVFEHVMVESRVNVDDVDLNGAWEEIQRSPADEQALTPFVDEIVRAIVASAMGRGRTIGAAELASTRRHEVFRELGSIELDVQFGSVESDGRIKERIKKCAGIDVGQSINDEMDESLVKGNKILSELKEQLELSDHAGDRLKEDVKPLLEWMREFREACARVKDKETKAGSA
jgi:hypothetical protein